MVEKHTKRQNSKRQVIRNWTGLKEAKEEHWMSKTNLINNNIKFISL